MRFFAWILIIENAGVIFDEENPALSVFNVCRSNQWQKLLPNVFSRAVRLVHCLCPQNFALLPNMLSPDNGSDR